MKRLQELLTIIENDDDEHLTPLKDLSEHNWHGRAWVRADDGQAAIDAVQTGGDGDVLMWHDWMNDTVYEVSLASTTKSGVMRNLESIKKAIPRAHIFIAYSTGEVRHRDWKEV